VPPPLSLAFARDIGGYLSGLTRYRQDAREAWIEWFAGALIGAADAAAEVLTEVDDLVQRWHERVDDLRADSTARRLVDELLVHPALDASRAARLLGVSPQAARLGLAQLAERGVLEPWRPEGTRGDRSGRRRNWWVAAELLDLVGP